MSPYYARLISTSVCVADSLTRSDEENEDLIGGRAPPAGAEVLVAGGDPIVDVFLEAQDVAVDSPLADALPGAAPEDRGASCSGTGAVANEGESGTMCRYRRWPVTCPES